MVFGVLDQLRKCNIIFTGYNIFKGMSETVAYTWFEIVLLKTIIYPAPEDNLQEPTPDFEDADDIEQYLREENS